MAEPYKISVIGAGEMGHGFAIQFVKHGNHVTLIDHRQGNIEAARSRIRDVVSFLQERGMIDRSADSVLDAIDFTLDQQRGVADADIVLETVSEDVATKETVLCAAEENAPATAVLATNTSGLSINEIADTLPRGASRLVGCHWWNPPYLMPLVEVVRGDQTSDSIVERTVRFVEHVDRTPILVKKDVPGFIWNRIQFAVLRECMHLLEEGVASVEAIDTAVREGYALRSAAIGPFETVDLSGLELFQSIATTLYPHLCDRKTPHERFDEYIDEGRHGVEAGAGFYEYDDSIEQLANDRDEKISNIRKALGSHDGDQ